VNDARDSVEELSRRASAGDLDAASQLVAATYQRIYAYLRRICGCEETASDLTQQTFASVWRSLPSFDGRANFTTWLHRIAHNVYVDWRRKGNRLYAQSDDWWETCVADGASPFENAADRDGVRLLYATVEQLEEDQRVVVHLHYYQGLTLQETADALDIATSTVKYRLRNALDSLKSRLAEPKLRA
jgi:RNA polymerase sigma-70 factor (ECF subfamily)